MSDAVIAGYVRSPFHFASKGALARTRPDDLAAAVVKGLVGKTGIDPKDVEDLLLGCAFPGRRAGAKRGAAHFLHCRPATVRERRHH